MLSPFISFCFIKTQATLISLFFTSRNRDGICGIGEGVPREDPVDSIWTELFSYAENLLLAADVGDSVNSHGDAFPK